MENKLDWITLLLYFVILVFGWLNIYAACYDESHAMVFDFSTKHGKQLIWIGVSLLLALVVSLTDVRLFSSMAYVFYLIMMVLLVVTLFVANVTKGGHSWIDFGSFKFQPTEFAKFATALALARYMSNPDVDYKQMRTKVISWTIVLIPALLTLLQHDTGFALVFAAFLFPMIREGMSPKILIVGIVAVVLFVTALLVNSYIVLAILAVIALFYLFVWLNKRTRKHYLWTIGLFLACSLFTMSVDFVFEHILEPHQRDRIYVLLGKTVDTHGTGYNVHQAKIAIGSGGLMGKGFLNGTITKADYVPEQETDFIFCTVGEEWGFVGATVVILLYLALLLRLIRLSERQYSRFTRFYGYSVASILFIHFFINIGMVIGLLPVIGIPLPFFSYGGSSLMAFTLLLFIFLRQDQERTQTLL